MDDYASRQRKPTKHLVGLGLVVVLHLLLFWAISSGLARAVVKKIQGPVEAVLLEDAKPDIPPPPPPPPPKNLPPPPAYVPPVDVVVSNAAPSANAIAAVSATPQPVAPAAPPAPPAPPAPVVKAEPVRRQHPLSRLNRCALRPWSIRPIVKSPITPARRAVWKKKARSVCGSSWAWMARSFRLRWRSLRALNGWMKRPGPVCRAAPSSPPQWMASLSKAGPP